MVTKRPPFRFGVLGERVTTREGVPATARRAEELGYSTLLLRDHFVGEPFGDQFAPLIALAAAAGATERLRVGTMVLGNDYRHPIMLAKEAATLDLLSGGRFELGLGAGWLRDEYERAGMAFDAPGVRVGRLEESLRVLKGLFAGGAFTFSGDHYQVADLETFPKPVQKPHPPILVGAGSKRMLGIAGREADIVGILPQALPNGTISAELGERSPEAVAQKVGCVREAAGERFDRVELSMIISPMIAEDHRKAAEQFAEARGWGPIPVERVLEMPSVFVGSEDRVVADMLERREQYGFSYFVVSDSNMETFAPVVARLGGA